MINPTKDMKLKIGQHEPLDIKQIGLDAQKEYIILIHQLHPPQFLDLDQVSGDIRCQIRNVLTIGMKYVDQLKIDMTCTSKQFLIA